MLGDLDAAQAYGVESLAMRRRLGDPEEIAHGSAALLASVAADREDYVSAQNLYEEAAALGRGGDVQTRAMLTGVSRTSRCASGTTSVRSRWVRSRSGCFARWRVTTERPGLCSPLPSACFAWIGRMMRSRPREKASSLRTQSSKSGTSSGHSFCWGQWQHGEVTPTQQQRSSVQLEALRARSGLMLAGAEAELRETAFDGTPGKPQPSYVRGGVCGSDLDVARRGGGVRARVHRLTSPWRRREISASGSRSSSARASSPHLGRGRPRPRDHRDHRPRRQVRRAGAPVREPEGLEAPAPDQPVRHRAADVHRVRGREARRRRPPSSATSSTCSRRRGSSRRCAACSS